MTTSRRAGSLLAAAALVAAGTTFTSPAEAHTDGIHDNCTNLNRKWKHGVGRANAVDRTSGARVTSFYRSTKQYDLAVSHNGTLDRDKDGIACEKK